MTLDDKTKVALAGFLTTIVLQFLKAKGIEWLDPATANALCVAAVGLAATLIAGHAHVEHGETMADAHIEAAQHNRAGMIEAAGLPLPGAATPPTPPPKP